MIFVDDIYGGEENKKLLSCSSSSSSGSSNRLFASVPIKKNVHRHRSYIYI